MSTRAGEWQQGTGRGAPVEKPRLHGATRPATSLFGAATGYRAAALSGAETFPGEPTTPDRTSTSDRAFGHGSAPTALRIWQLLSAACWRLWAGIEARRAGQRRRSLRVLETVGMGEKRFVAIVQVEEARFLIGGGSGGVSLLARLDTEREFAAILDEQAAAPASLSSLIATGPGVEAAVGVQPVSTKVAW